MSRLPATAAFALLLLPVGGCAAEPPPGPVVYSVLGMDKVGVKRNLVYKKTVGAET